MKKFSYLLTFILAMCIIGVVSAEKKYNNYVDKTYSCGEKLVTDIPETLPKVIHIVYVAIQIIVPVVLVILGTLDLLKAMSANKEDEIKNGQQIFVKRLIAAVIVFFVFALAKFVVSLVADGNKTKIIDCMDCFINEKCS